MGIPAAMPIPPGQIESVKWEPPWLPTPCWNIKEALPFCAFTRGFGDALKIGYQSRPDIFARQIILPEPLYRAVVEVEERIDAGGHVIREPDMDRVRLKLRAHHDAGIRSVAIVLMHGWRV